MTMINSYIDQIIPCNLVSIEAPGWKWEILEKAEDGINYLARVYSPFVEGGELGYVNLEDLNSQINLITA